MGETSCFAADRFTNSRATSSSTLLRRATGLFLVRLPHDIIVRERDSRLSERRRTPAATYSPANGLAVTQPTTEPAKMASLNSKPPWVKSRFSRTANCSVASNQTVPPARARVQDLGRGISENPQAERHSSHLNADTGRKLPSERAPTNPRFLTQLPVCVCSERAPAGKGLHAGRTIPLLTRWSYMKPEHAAPALQPGHRSASERLHPWA